MSYGPVPPPWVLQNGRVPKPRFVKRDGLWKVTSPRHGLTVVGPNLNIVWKHLRELIVQFYPPPEW